MLQTAKSVGLPQDQVANFVNSRYAPQPKQMVFHASARNADADDGPTEIGYGGARGGGKTVAMLAQMALDDCQRYPGLKCLLLRRVGRAVRESVEDLRMRLLKYTDHEYNKSRGALLFPNGSRIVLGHYQNEADVDNYLGLEYDVIGVEEATTLSAQKYRIIRTCNRTGKLDWRPRTYSNANPGGVGHAWYKKKFILGASEDEKVTFIPATYRDNAFLNDEYVDNVLGALTGWLKRAWKDGDWDIAAGQFFTNFSTDIHVIEPIKTEQYWDDYWFALDYGWIHPTAVLLLGKHRGKIYVIDEFAASKQLPHFMSNRMNKMLAENGLTPKNISRVVIGQDAWKKTENNPSVARGYEKEGWSVVRADMARVEGALQILDMLGDPDGGIDPSLQMFNRCVGLIETLPRMQHDPHRPEDVLKVDANRNGEGGDDFYDALRYGIMSYNEGKLVRSDISFARR